jgi:hypothetical protein
VSRSQKYFVCPVSSSILLSYFGSVLLHRMRRDSVVGIVISYGLGDRWGRSSSPGRVKNFSFLHAVKTGLLSNGYWG